MSWNDEAEKTYTPTMQAETDQHCREVCGCEPEYIADLEAQIDALSRVVGAMGKEYQTGDLTLKDALDAVALMKSGQGAQAATELEATPLAEAFFRSESEVARLTAQVAKLTAFVVAYDAHEAFRRTVPDDGMELWVAEWEWLLKKAKEARAALDWPEGAAEAGGEG